MSEISRGEINQIIKRIDENVHEIRNHLKTLNGSVAKHNKWIDENNKILSNDFPEVQKMTRNNDKKLYAFGIVIVFIQAVIGIVIKLY